MFSFLHAADIHLDSPLLGLQRYEGAPVEEMRLATRKALENLVQLAIDREVDFVLIAGDLYDGDWKDHNTGLFFVNQAMRLRAAGVRLYVISGNHDAANRMTKSLSLAPNSDDTPMMLSHRKPESIELEDLGVAIHGRGFAKQHERESLLNNYPPATPGLFNIGLLHTSLEEKEGEHACYAPCTKEDLKDHGYDYWALGHIHKREVKHEDPLIVFPGNTQGRHIREEGAKGCYLVTVDDDHRASLEFQPLDAARWAKCKVSAEGLSHDEQLLEQFAASLQKKLDAADGRMLAVRVLIEKIPPEFRHWAAHPQAKINQLRATALETSLGSAWVEKVEFEFAQAPPRTGAGISTGPLNELLDYLKFVKQDDAQLRQLRAELDDLERKLPDELKHGAELIRGGDALRFDDPDWLRARLDEVAPRLTGMLTAREDGA